MSVQQVKELFEQGKLGELAATSYAQGVFDGLLAMEGVRINETGQQQEFCGLIGPNRRGQPVQHPAYRTGELLKAWQKQGRSMSLPFPDLAFNYLSAQYGCKR